jgi:hypothetical protein
MPGRTVHQLHAVAQVLQQMHHRGGDAALGLEPCDKHFAACGQALADDLPLRGSGCIRRP